MTYKPGVKLVKMDTDPKTYAVEQGGMLRHVSSESIASTLYGTNWNTKVDDVPDSFFTNYTIGAPIERTDEYSPSGATSAVADISEDKGLVPYNIISFTTEGIQSAEGDTEVVIEEHGTVAFVNATSSNHSAISEDGSWNTGTIVPGGFFVRRFTERGNYEFHDGNATHVTATVIVE